MKYRSKDVREPVGTTIDGHANACALPIALIIKYLVYMITAFHYHYDCEVTEFCGGGGGGYIH